MYHQDYDDEELDGPRVSVVDRVKGFFAGLRHNNDDLDEVSSERPTGRIYDIGTKDRVRITTHPEQTITILTVYEFNDAQKVADRLRTRICQVTGKTPLKGNKVSFSNKKSIRRFMPNLQKKRFFLVEEDKWIVLKLTTDAMRTINKQGLFNVVKRLRAEGQKI